MRYRSLLAWLSFALILPQLGGCFLAVAGVAVGASAAHDRRGVGAYLDDKRIVYDGVMLLTGEVRTPELKKRAQQRVSGFEGTQRIVNELEIAEPEGFWSRRRDNTLTAQVKTALLDLTSMPDFDPTRVNVTTAHRVVYLMGKVSHAEDDAVTHIVRDVAGVERVVKLFAYTD